MTYRQVDHWARQGYVVPSVQGGIGKGARRLFSAADVVRVAALGRFGRARLDIGLVGPLVAALDPINDPNQLVVAHTDPLGVEIVVVRDLRSMLAVTGACIVFDPAPVLARLEPRAVEGVDRPRVDETVELREVS